MQNRLNLNALNHYCHSRGACAGLDPVAGIQNTLKIWTPAFAGVTFREQNLG